MAAFGHWNAYNYFHFAAVLVTLLVFLQEAESGILTKRETGDYSGNKLKRPFCNAFTGCGKKRSSPSAFQDETGDELTDIAKNVLAEAKMWEKLQNRVDMMQNIASQMEERPPLFRKKRSLNDRHKAFIPDLKYPLFMREENEAR